MAASPPTRRDPPTPDDAAAGLGAATLAQLVAAGAAVGPAALGATGKGAAVSALSLPHATAAAAAEAIEAALGGFWMQQLAIARDKARARLGEALPSWTPSALDRAVEEELAYEEEFRRRSRVRWQRDLPAALGLADPAARRRALRSLLDRERRYAEQRYAAIVRRVEARVERERVRDASPLGAYWTMDPRLKEHTPGCAALAGHFWPWAVVDRVHPPVHASCGCRLWSLDQAVRRGWMRRDQVPEEADAIRRAQLLARRIEELHGELSEAEITELMEASARHAGRYDARYARGTAKGGEFRPRRGGSAGGLSRRLVRKDLRRLLEPPPHAAAREDREPVRVGGRTVMVPWSKVWRGTVGGGRYYSPPQSTNVYREHVPVLRSSGEGLLADLRSKAAELVGGRRREALDDMRARVAAGQGPILRGEPADRLGLMPLLGFRRTATNQASADGRPAVEDHYRDAEGRLVTVTRGNAPEGYTDVLGSTLGNAKTPDARALDRPPRTFEEFKADTAAWGLAMADRHGRSLGLTDIGEDPDLSDTAAYRDWDGVVRFGPDARGAVENAARARAEGRPLTDGEALDMLIAQQTAQHEAGHAIDPELEYRMTAPGRRWVEESLAEEVGLRQASRHLAETGQTEVLQWMADHPDHIQLQGNYRPARQVLASALDRAGLAPEDREAFLERLKYDTDPEERLGLLAGMAAKHNETGKESELRRLTADFQHPDDADRTAPWYALPSLPPEAARLSRQGPSITLRLPGDELTLRAGTEVHASPEDDPVMRDDEGGGGKGRVVALDRDDDGSWTAQVGYDDGSTGFVHGLRDGGDAPGWLAIYPPIDVSGALEGDRVAWMRPDGGETEGTLARVLKRDPFGGWAFEADLDDGRRAVVTNTSTRGLRKLGGAETSPPDGTPGGQSSPPHATPAGDAVPTDGVEHSPGRNPEVPLGQAQRWLNEPPPGAPRKAEPITTSTTDPAQQTAEEFAADPATWWHGTEWPEMGEGDPGLVHLGDWYTAQEALAARVGHAQHGGLATIPETLSTRRLIPGGPEGGDTWVPAGHRPRMVPVRIVGPMDEGVLNDIVGDPDPALGPSAESILRGQVHRGVTPRQGYFYLNQGEGTYWEGWPVPPSPDEIDSGGADLLNPVSAVVPSPDWLRSHEDYVREALARGDKVPEHVLADYPQLSREASPGSASPYTDPPEYVPGMWAKGYVVNGDLRLWRVDPKNGMGPDHREVSEMTGLADLTDYDATITVTPDGFATEDSGFTDPGLLRAEWPGLAREAFGVASSYDIDTFAPGGPVNESDADRPAWEVELERRRDAMSQIVRGAGLKWEPDQDRWWQRRALPELDKREASPGRAEELKRAERERVRARPETAEDRLFVANNAERLPADQARALGSYTSGGGNAALGPGDRPALERLVRSHPLPEALPVWRKVRAGELDGLRPGDVLAEDRFVSTAAGTAWGIGVTQNNGSLAVELPAGTPAYYVPQSYGTESEVVLPPGLPLRITEVGERDGRPYARAVADPGARPTRGLSKEFRRREDAGRRLYAAERDEWRARHGLGDLPAAQRALEDARRAGPLASPGRAQEPQDAGPTTELGRGFARTLQGTWPLPDGRALRSKVDGTGRSFWGSGTTAEGTIVDPAREDRVVGAFRRTLRWNHGQLEVTKDQVWVDPAYRRQGLAARMDREMEARWGALGVRRVRVSSTIEDGGYVWARLGYTLDYEEYLADTADTPRGMLDGTPGFEGLDPTPDNLRRNYLYRVIESNYQATADPGERERDHELKGIEGAPDQPTPARLREVLDMVRAGKLGDVGDVAALPDGRELLWGSDWAGYKNIEPPPREESPGRARPASELGWVPDGRWGKGWLFADGHVVTWPTDEMGGAPHHEASGLFPGVPEDFDPGDWSQALPLVISPEGGVATNTINATDPMALAPEDMRALRAVDSTFRRPPGTSPISWSGTETQPSVTSPPERSPGRAGKTLADARTGEPIELTLWHGTTPSAIDAIRREGFHPGTAGAWGPGVYLAGSPEMADYYARPDAMGAAISTPEPMEVRAKLRSPLVGTIGDLQKQMPGVTADQVPGWLRKRGHDSLVVRYPHSGAEEAVLLDPSAAVPVPPPDRAPALASPGRTLPRVPAFSTNKWFPGGAGKAWVWPDERRVVAWPTSGMGDPEHGSVDLHGETLPNQKGDNTDVVAERLDSGAYPVTLDADGTAHDPWATNEADAPLPEVMETLRSVMGSEVQARQGRREESPGRAMDAYAERAAALGSKRLGEMEAARELGVTVPEYRERVAARLREVTAPGKARVAMRMPTNGILGLLRDGRAKTQHETFTSGGWQGDRTDTERRLFGEPGSPTDWPVYGYLSTPDEPDPVPENPIVTQYGQWRVVLHDSVRPRTTIFFGDTLDDFDTGTATHVPLDAPTADAVPAFSGMRPLTVLEADPAAPGTPLFFNGWLNAPAAEAAVHGGVTLADVESVEYRPTGENSAEPDKRVVDLLREKGIPLSVRPRVDGVPTSGELVYYSPGRASDRSPDELSWEPGATGKGFVLEDGAVWTWPTTAFRPMHMAKDYTRRRRGLPRPVPGSAFHVTAEGLVHFIGEGRGHDERLRDLVTRADPRLHYGGDAPSGPDTAHAGAILDAVRPARRQPDELVGVTPSTEPAPSPGAAMAFAVTPLAREFRRRVKRDLRESPDVELVTTAEGPGVFGGESEYSWTLGLSGPHDAIERLAVGWAGDYDQEQVALARLDPDGPHHVWTWSGVDRDAAVAAMERAGVYGGALTGGNLSIFDTGDMTAEQVLAISEALGTDASERPARVRFLDRRPDGTYGEAEAGEGGAGPEVPGAVAAAAGLDPGAGRPAAAPPPDHA